MKRGRFFSSSVSLRFISFCVVFSILFLSITSSRVYASTSVDKSPSGLFIFDSVLGSYRSYYGSGATFYNQERDAFAYVYYRIDTTLVNVHDNNRTDYNVLTVDCSSFNSSGYSLSSSNNAMGVEANGLAFYAIGSYDGITSMDEFYPIHASSGGSAYDVPISSLKGDSFCLYYVVPIQICYVNGAHQWFDWAAIKAKFPENISLSGKYDETYSAPTQSDVNKVDDSIKKGNELQKEQNETSKGILGKITEFFASFFENLKGLFVPEDGYFSDFFTRLNDFFSEKLGMLYAPIDMFITFLNTIKDASSTESGITFPELAWDGTVIIPETKFSFDTIYKDFPDLKEKIYFVTDVILVGAVLWLLQIKLKEVLEN